jgi:glycerol-3-phosphate dehydrogenase
VLDARGVLAVAPSIPASGLVAGAVWYDLALRCPGRAIIEVLRWAADLGGVAVNYCEALGLLISKGRVRGVAVADCSTSAELRAQAVINAAGPWAGELAAQWGAGDGRLAPLVAAWNVLLDRPVLSDHAVALQDPSDPGAALKFATGLGGRLLVGTGYAPLRGRCDSDGVPEDGLDSFLAAVNRCLPALEITRRDVVRVFSGVLPAAGPGSAVPRARNLLVGGGPRGLVTISGTKLTTARAAARQAIAGLRCDARPAHSPQECPRSRTTADYGLFGDEWTLEDVEKRRGSLRAIIEQEAVEHLDDLVLRRTTLGDQPVRAVAAARQLCALDERWRRERDREVARLAARLGWPRAAWAMNRPAVGENEAAVARTA